MDAITLLKADHKSVEKHFRAFESTTGRAKATRSTAARTAVRELATHAALEEQIFYPAVELEVPELGEELLRSLEAHHVVKWLCAELASSSPDDDRFAAKMSLLIDNVRLHVEEEEADVFPYVRQALGRRRLLEIGELLEKAKPLAPTHPHPRAPDTPPVNALTGVVAGAFDVVRDMGQRLVGHLTP